MRDKKVDVVIKNVEVIEKATNSMKDALVAATKEAAFEQGKTAERLDPEQQTKRRD